MRTYTADEINKMLFEHEWVRVDVAEKLQAERDEAVALLKAILNPPPGTTTTQNLISVLKEAEAVVRKYA